MKTSPYLEHAESIPIDQRARDFLKGLNEQVDVDIEDREQYRAERRMAFLRRYGLLNRNPEYPWRGSANINMPLVDMMIDRVKPMFTGLVFETKPPVTVLTSHGRESQQQARNIEHWFQWLLEDGSPRFYEEMVLGIDNILEGGRCVFKTSWQYDTIVAPELFLADKLPQDMLNFVVRFENPQQREVAAAVAQSQGMSPVPGLSIVEFDQARDKIKETLILRYGFDPDEKEDQQTLESVLRWLRGGAKGHVRANTRRVINDGPRITSIDWHEFVVPEYTTELEDCDRICHRLFMTPRYLKQQAHDGMWSRKAMAKYEDGINRGQQRYAIVKKRGSFPTKDDFDRAEQEYRQKQGSHIKDERDEIREVCCYYSPNNSALERRAVALYHKDMPEQPFKFYWYSESRWPYETTSFEMNKRSFFSPRGIPEKIKDISDEVTATHRAKLNRATIQNSPTFMYRRSAGLNVANINWTPGQFIPVNRIDDIAPMPVPNVDVAFDNEEDRLRLWTESYLGASDFASGVGQRSPDRRTASEVNAIVGQQNQAISLRGNLFQRMMSNIYSRMHQLSVMYGPHMFMARTTGDEMVNITRHELEGDYRFQIRGKIGQSDPVLETQKALNRFQLLMQAAAAAGDKYEVDLGEALRDWFEQDDIRAFRRIVRERSPEEIEQIQQQRAQAAEEERAALAGERSPEETLATLKEIEKKSPNGATQKVSV